jgi:hypothetical protein
LNQKPIYMTTFALARLLKEVLLDLGFSDLKADVVSQVHLQETVIPARWSEFIETNCARCAHAPSSCLYLNPTEEQCMGSSTPSELRAANAMMIETGRTANCPLYVPWKPE